jgi:SAM-dependent methyltransferase
MGNKSHYQAWMVLIKTWGKYVMPPAKPCKGQLKIYDKILKDMARKVERPRSLILGSTPEFRDLCIKNNFKTTACDINPHMIKAMNQLMRYKNNPKNIALNIDWLKMKFPKNSYDLVMGDLSLGQILNEKKLEHLLKKIAFILKPEGIFLTREPTRYSVKPMITGKKWIELIKQYEKGKMNEVDLYFFYKHQSDANDFTKSPSIMDWPPVLYKLIDIKKKTKLKGLNRFIKWSLKTLSTKPKPMIIYTKKGLENLLGKYFNLSPIKQCDDHAYCKYMPMFLAKPKR